MFKISLGPGVAHQFRALVDAAELRGEYHKLIDSAQRMNHELRNNPVRLGESRDPEPVGGFLKRIAFFPMITAYFAVHEQGKVVLIMQLGPNI